MTAKIKNAQRLISVVVVASYFCKATVKLITGIILSIPPLIADGIHSFIDIAEHGFLVVGGYVARKQDKKKYPLDRQPLLDLLGMIIFGGLISLGAAMVLQAIQIVLKSSAFFGWVNSVSVDWLISESNNELLSLESEHILLATFIMIISYGISELVYRFEFRLAENNNIPEMKADAMELRSDGWLELGMGLSLLVAWMLNIFLSEVYENTQLNAVSTLVLGIITLVLGIYLFILGIREFYKSYKNLMNQAIDEEKRNRLEQELRKRLPENCEIVSPLIGYHRGAQLFIKGYIQIDRNLMQSSDVIISNCEKIAEMFFAETRKEVHSQFSPFFSWSKKTILDDLNKVVENIFEVDINSKQAKAFRLMRFGKLDSAIELINSNKPNSISEESLSIFIFAESYLQKFGPKNESTHKYVDLMKDHCLKIENIDILGILFSWLLIYHIKLYRKDKDGQNVIYKFQKKVEDILRNNSLSDYSIAELYFALGFSWERTAQYDLDKTRKFYKLSEQYYTKSGLRSEVDRLMNTMGHMESLLYSLADSDIHLTVAREIRELKNDKLGLSYTYGSLGDLYVKMGLFEDALEYYNKDVVYLEDLNIDHFLPDLNVKIGELKIRIGMLSSDNRKILDGIDLCQKSELLLEDPFFAKKGIVKGYLCLSILSNEKESKSDYLNKVDNYLKDMVSNNNYQKAFYYRLKGRYDALLGNHEEAIKSLKISKLNFNEMRDPILDAANGMQEIISSIEAYKWEFFNSEIDLSDAKEQIVGEVQKFIESIGGMLGSSKYRFEELIASISNKKVKTKVELLKQMDMITWNLEG